MSAPSNNNNNNVMSSSTSSDVNYFRILNDHASEEPPATIANRGAPSSAWGGPPHPAATASSSAKYNAEQTIKMFTLSCLLEPLRFHIEDQSLTQTITTTECVSALRRKREALHPTDTAADDAPKHEEEEKRFTALLTRLLEPPPTVEHAGNPLAQSSDEMGACGPSMSLAIVPSFGEVQPMEAAPEDLVTSQEEFLTEQQQHDPHQKMNGPRSEDDDLTAKRVGSRGQQNTVTFRESLNYTSPAFPATSAAERAILLNVLGNARSKNAQLVRKRDVLEALSQGTTPALDGHFEKIADNLFDMGSDYLLIEAYADLVVGLTTHSVKDDFVSYNSTESLVDMSLMAGFLPTLVLVIFSLVMIVTLDVRTMFTFSRTIEWPTTDDWVNFCTEGVTKPCYFAKRNIGDMGTTEMALQYYRTELVEHLWAWNSSLTRPVFEGTWGGAWLVGGLLLRVSSVAKSPSANEHFVATCKDLNLTEEYWDRRLGTYFSCNAFAYSFVPFSDTKANALATLSSFEIDIPVVDDAVVIANFGALRPTDGLYAWATIATVVPRSGSTWPRSKIRVYRLGDDLRILPIMIIQLIVTIYQCVTRVVVGQLKTGSKKVHWRTLVSVQTTWSVFLSVLMIASYAYLRAVTAPEAPLQASYIPKGMDASSQNYDNGIRLFGMYILFLALSLLLFVGQVDDLRFLKELVAACIRDLVGMMVVFALVLFGFAMIGISMFGEFVPAFSSGLTAIIAVAQYLLGRGDLSEITENYIGFSVTYFVALKLFITFFVLNLLIAVVTAPLGDIREELNLYSQLADGTKRRHARRCLPQWHSLLLTLRLGILSSLNIIRDVFRVPLMPSEVQWQTVFHQLVHSGEACQSFSEVMDSAEFLLDKLDEFPSCRWWRSPLVEEVEVQVGGHKDPNLPKSMDQEGEYDEMVSYVLPLLQLQITASTPYNIFRDAWLSRVLAVFDTFSTRRSRLADQHEAERRRNAGHSETLHNRTVRAAMVRGKQGKKHHAPETTNPQTPKGGEHRFAFTYFVEKRLYGSLFDVIAAITTVVLFFVFAFSLMNGSTTSAFLTNNVHRGLRDQFYNQQCFDTNCTTAFTQKKTFRDIGHLSDVIQYVTLLFIPQIFPSSLKFVVPFADYDMNYLLSTSAVAWDNYLRRVGNVTIRQLRANPKDRCTLPDRDSDAAFGVETARLDAIYGSPCYSTETGSFSQSDMVRPPNSLLSSDAYVFRTDCPEVNNEFVIGDLDWYPCSGYAATFNTSQEMMYAVTNWIDAGTRLIVFSIVVDLDGDTAQYNQYFEMGDSGGTTVAWTRVFPLTSRDLMVTRNICVLVLIAVDTALFLLMLVRYWWFSSIRSNIREVLRPDVPWVNILVIVIVLGFGLAPGLTEIIRRVVIDVTILVWLIFKTLMYAMFPIAELFSRHVTVVRRTFALALSALITMLVFFCVAFAAFFLSGHLLFGRSILSFGSVPQAALNVMGYFLGALDVDTLYGSNEQVAYVYILVVFAVATVLLSNLVLTLIVSAAETARQEVGNTAFLEKLAPHLNAQVLGGPLVRFLVLCSIWLNRLAPPRSEEQVEGSMRRGTSFASTRSRDVSQQNGDVHPASLSGPSSPHSTLTRSHNNDSTTDSRSSNHHHHEDTTYNNSNRNGNNNSPRPSSLDFGERIVTTANGRLPTPSECLQSWFGPYRLSEVAELVQLHRQPRWLALSTAAMLIGEITMFEEEFPVATWQDHAVEAHESAKHMEGAALSSSERHDAHV